VTIVVVAGTEGVGVKVLVEAERRLALEAYLYHNRRYNRKLKVGGGQKGARNPVWYRFDPAFEERDLMRPPDSTESSKSPSPPDLQLNPH
jgi:hypothetical protein